MKHLTFFLILVWPLWVWPKPLTFSGRQLKGEEILIAAVGDFLIHRELQKQGWKSEQGFVSLWSPIEDLIQGADIAYGNFEGTSAPGLDVKGRKVEDPGPTYDNKVYTGYPKFNYHPALLKAIAKSGWDILSTANNHALDRQTAGLYKTIASIKRAGLRYTGTRKAMASEKGWPAILEVKGFRIAWLACTEHTNRQKDPEHRVLYCRKDQKWIVQWVKKTARRKDIDAIILTPHWGKQYRHEVQDRQRKWAHQMLEAGALVILGSHPHVIQPWEKYQCADGRETLIVYSLGNFVSHQPELPKRSTILLYLGLIRDPQGQVKIKGVGYVPLHTRHDRKRDFYITEAIDRSGGWVLPRAMIVNILGEDNLLPPQWPVVFK